MIFCIENAESVEEIVEMLNESFNNLDSPLNKTVCFKQNFKDYNLIIFKFY